MLTFQSDVPLGNLGFQTCQKQQQATRCNDRGDRNLRPGHHGINLIDQKRVQL